LNPTATVRFVSNYHFRIGHATSRLTAALENRLLSLRNGLFRVANSVIEFTAAEL
jgi:hypothetical protein